MTAARRIGFVGLGNMGAPMARRLAQGGFSVLAYDIRDGIAESLCQAEPGIEAAIAPGALGELCETVITMLPDASAVRQAVLGGSDRAGLARYLARGSVVVDMSSSAPAATVALGEALQALGLYLVDAPVSGGVPRATDGSLTIMAGGTAEHIDKLAPVFACLGRVQRTGALGSGHAMKALNNYVSAAGLLAVCEALIVARRFGLDPKVANDVLNSSTGRNNTTDRKVEPFMLSRSFDSGFSLALLRKDVGMAQDLAAGLELDAPWLQACQGLLDEAAAALGESADHTEAFVFLERRLAGEAESP
ncbi:MAG: NAD(P)-dependent oxidoreductase [Kiloniellales bacterium]|nr:NAD(P)-dependent oxidoreductase [Kiloniellales bacterium]